MASDQNPQLFFITIKINLSIPRSSERNFIKSQEENGHHEITLK